MKSITLILTLASLAFAADPVAPAPAKAPEIPLDHQLAYFKADDRVSHIQPLLDKATTDMRDAVAVIAKDCGSTFQPSMDGDTLKCVPIPQPPKKEEPKK